MLRADCKLKELSDLQTRCSNVLDAQPQRILRVWPWAPAERRCQRAQSRVRRKDSKKTRQGIRMAEVAQNACIGFDLSIKPMELWRSPKEAPTTTSAFGSSG